MRHGLQPLLAEVLPHLRVKLAGSLAATVQVLQTTNRFDPLQALGAPKRTQLLVLLRQRGYRVPPCTPGAED